MKIVLGYLLILYRKQDEYIEWVLNYIKNILSFVMIVRNLLYI